MLATAILAIFENMPPPLDCCCVAGTLLLLLLFVVDGARFAGTDDERERVDERDCRGIFVLMIDAR